MIEDDIYTFRIDAYTPETIPMARLAEYMSELAAMFGEKERVHFKELKTGSTKLLSRVEREAAPKVRTNLQNVSSGEDSEAARSFKKLNELLRNDNAEAKLTLGKSNILNFPGRKAVRPPKLGPFNQGVVRDGVLVRIGGKDKSAHAHIEDGDGNTWIFEISRELAKELAHYLFAKPVRLIGHGRWFRDEEGFWQYSSLKAVEFKPLEDASLVDVVGRVRDLPKETWGRGIDSLELLRSLRDDGEVH